MDLLEKDRKKRRDISCVVGICLASGVLLVGCFPTTHPLQMDIPYANVVAKSSLIDRAQPIRPLEKPVGLNPEKVQLGKKLFHNQSLSADNTVSCATCHDIRNGGDDGLAKSKGIEGRLGDVNSPTVINSSRQWKQFWDGRVDTLAQQVDGPIHHPAEMGSTWPEIIAKLHKDPKLVSEFRRVYSQEITAENVIDAIVQYERALVDNDSAFDRYLRGDKHAISAKAETGYELFQQLGCISCHHGQNIGANSFQHFGVMGDYFADRGNVTEADYGRFNVTGHQEDMFAFKVPSLRNVDMTAPYFHDGTAATLHEAIEVMAKYQLGFDLTLQEIEQLICFLQTLTGSLPEELL